MALADRLTELVAPVIEEEKFRLWDIKVTKAGKRSIVTVLIDKDGGADADELAHISKTIAPILDEDPSLEASYHLEIATPGLERSLTKPEHYTWSIGMDVTVAYRIDGSINRIKGNLIGFENDMVTIKNESDEEKLDIELDTITKAHTLFDFQSAMKKAEEMKDDELIPQGETA